MEALHASVTARKNNVGAPSAPSAVTPPRIDPATRRRAFSAMHGQAANEAMTVRARTALERGRDSLAAERDAMARHLGQALGLDAPDMQAVAAASAPKADAGWMPVLFVSSSMPIDELRTYAGQLERARGVMAFRGMPGGLHRVAPMAKLSAEILRLDPGCEGPNCAMRNIQLIIDPIVFREHGVTRVPALAMLPGDPTRPYCERDDGASAPVASHVVYGDAALSGLLEEYARLGGAAEVRDAEARLGAR